MKSKTVNLNSNDSTIVIKADLDLLKKIDELRRKQTDHIPTRSQMIIRAIKWAYDYENREAKVS